MKLLVQKIDMLIIFYVKKLRIAYKKLKMVRNYVKFIIKAIRHFN